MFYLFGVAVYYVAYYIHMYIYTTLFLYMYVTFDGLTLGFHHQTLGVEATRKGAVVCIKANGLPSGC